MQIDVNALPPRARAMVRKILQHKDAYEGPPTGTVRFDIKGDRIVHSFEIRDSAMRATDCMVAA